VWDYVEDTFVHGPTTRPIEESHGGGDTGRPTTLRDFREPGESLGKDDQQGKLANLCNEYNALLASQLDEQRRYYEELLAKTEAELAQDACRDDQLAPEEKEEAVQVRKAVLH